MAALLTLIPVVLLLADHGAHPVGLFILIGLIPALVFIAVAVPATAWVRRHRPQWQTPPLAAGATRNTRREVRQAFRAGYTSDARIDALAREQAQKTVRNTAAVKIYGGLFALQLALLVLRIIAGGSTSALILAVIGDALWAVGFTAMVLNLSRCRRYLREQPRGDQMP